jgi:hypothetical protein
MEGAVRIKRSDCCCVARSEATAGCRFISWLCFHGLLYRIFAFNMYNHHHNHSYFLLFCWLYYSRKLIEDDARCVSHEEGGIFCLRLWDTIRIASLAKTYERPLQIVVVATIHLAGKLLVAGIEDCWKKRTVTTEGEG